MSIPLVDLRAQYAAIKGEIDQAIDNVLVSGEFILGTEVAKFGQEMASYCGTEYAIGVNSGTDALYLALKACGVGPGDEVITTAFTFIATAEAIVHCGARPVFADIEPATFNLDWRRVEALITSRTRAIIPVHLYGHPVDMEPLLGLARSYSIKVIEDCAQALGARYKGKPVGSLGDAGCLSFFPSKNLGAYGDGGMVVTSDEELTAQVDLLRKHGSHPQQKYYHLLAGFNSRLDTVQAAILRVKLRHLDSWVKGRKEKAAFYDELLSVAPGIQIPSVAPYADHAFNYYTIRLTSSRINRDELQKYLKGCSISTAVYYPLALHLQPAFKELGYQFGDLPETELAQEQVMSLPIYPELDSGSQLRITNCIAEFTSATLR